MSERSDATIETTVSGRSFECPGCDYSTIVFGEDNHADICPECGTDALVPADDAETIRENRREAVWAPPVGKHADVEDLYGPVVTPDTVTAQKLLQTPQHSYERSSMITLDPDGDTSLEAVHDKVMRKYNRQQQGLLKWSTDGP